MFKLFKWAKREISVAVIAGTMLVVLFAPTYPVSAATAAVGLGTAYSFAVLAGSAVTNVPTSTISGNVGLSPAAGSNYAGLTALEVTGTIYAVDATGPGGSVNNPGLLTAAKNDLTTAYLNAAARPWNFDRTATPDLGGGTLVPGVYKSDSSLAITGTLTLDGGGDPNAVFIFQAGSSLTTADTNSTVILQNGTQACNVFWQVGTSATIGKNTTFVGNILAATSITLNTGASVSGRVLALTGAVTLDTNSITIPAVAWESYNDETRNVQDNTFASPETTVYMKGTGFEPSTSYFVAYFDANGNQVSSELKSSDGSRNLLSLCALSDTGATAGIWNALVQLDTTIYPVYTSFGTASYTEITAAPGTYGLVANDTFNVDESALPELPTVFAGIFIASACGGIYWLMRKRRTARALKS